MYVINEYQLVTVASDVYLTNANLGAKIPHPKFAELLAELKQCHHLECSEDFLMKLSQRFGLDSNALKKVLIEQLNVIKPMLQQKIPLIYINCDVALIKNILQETLSKYHNVQLVNEEIYPYEQNSMVIYFRNNYSHQSFNSLYQNLDEDVYLVTAGVLHQLLIIDNLYVAGSGLPTHCSNLHQMMAYLKSSIPATKNNWLLLYREMIKNSMAQFPDPEINSCQQAYIAYCLNQFIAQFTNLWQAPTPLDQINCFWQADLNSFSIVSEAALHSPFAEQDMKLNLNHMNAREFA
ncbi:hypothetical protein [Legionella bononiensis]|uniref:Uncharacterized protein n=1 Tax=Legionella bononiensis TaxID=2793102 RepID=A0ABS1W6V6_9GAMM|nr:hypothetical protein [Legionella bononiensis]MBL7525085.1 hypothetical protein [Legionella bononiensis]MBL7562810.1 hypothetical protein [Legionella bononiensis]